MHLSSGHRQQISMKLSKTKHKLLDEAYNTLIQVCLFDSPLEEMAPLLAEDVMNFGAGKKELTQTKAAFLKQIKNQKELAEGLKMDFAFTPVLRKIMNEGNGAIYTDDIVNTVWVNKVKDELKFRLSFIFEYRESNWFLVHSHTSTPDPQRTDEEVWPVEELKKRTQFLEKSLEEKISELSIKNRELEIEASLERVRARAMAMQNSDELSELAYILFEQLKQLGTELRWCWFSIFDEDFKGINSWYTDVDGTFNPLPIHQKIRDFRDVKYALKAWKAGDELYLNEIKGKELIAYVQELGKNPEFKKGLTYPTFKKNLSGCLYQTHAIFKHGYIGYSSFKSRKKENVIYFPRFAKVFEQTYTRFLDLRKAETQAREAKIEAAMERIRSRAIAMRTSDELLEVALEMRIQADRLGQQDLEASVVHLYEKDAAFFESLAAMRTPGVDGEITTYRLKFPVTATKEIEQMIKNYWSGLSEYTIEVNQKMREKWQSVLQKYAPELFNQRFQYEEKEIEEDQKEYWNFADFSGGSLLTVTYSPPSPETKEFFKRSADVFDLAYRRYNDLQKAEAQTRESRINLAVERVRAMALAMHKSEDIMRVVSKLKDEVMSLDIPDVVAATIFLNEGDDNIRMWDLTSIEKTDEGFQVPLDITFKLKKVDPHLYVKRVWENPNNYFVETQDEKGFKRILEWLRQHNKTEVAEEVEEYIKAYQIKLLYHTTKKLNNGKLCIDLLNPPSDEMESILTKMGAAFDLAYKRFEDLQKAESRAREAQIEAALERVRSKTMAMHNSQDVGDTVVTLFDEVMKLGLDKSLRCGLGILEGTEQMETWSANYSPDGKVNLRTGMLNMTIHPMLVRLKKAWKNKKPGYSYKFIGEDVTKYYNALNKEPQYPYNVDLKTLPEKVFHNSFFFSSGILFGFTENPISVEAAQVLKRFANVFGQTYRRYLDLQKAEAQAREAQIEAGLERVRASAMAMQSADDLLQVSNVLRAQMANLGQAALESSIIHLYEEDKDKILAWYSYRNPNSPSDKIISDEARPHKKSTAYIRKTIAKYKSGETEYTIVAKGEMLREWYKELESLNADVLDYDENGAIVVPDVLYYHYSNFSGGSLLMVSNEAPAQETKELQKRAAGVFDMAYRRYLDLKKAEKQAREAQIEAALERVRASSMAMHKSEDLPETAQVLFEQFALLGNMPDRISIGIIKEEEKLIELWATDQIGSQLDHAHSGPLDEATTITKLHKAWKEGKDSFVVDLSGQKLKDWVRYIKEDMKMYIDDSHIKGRRVQQAAFFSKGMLLCTTNEPVSDEIMQLLIRFTKVFDQTYTRFLDLQKAEAQAREAQVETALEKVRSRTMAMQRSEELTQVADVLFGQIQELGTAGLRRCVICIFNNSASSFELWYTSEDGNSNTKSIIIPTTGNDVAKWMTKTWKEKRTDSMELEEAKIQDFVGFLEHHGWIYPKGEKPAKYMVLSVCPFSHGTLMPVTYKQLGKSEFELLQRFASVFQQTYTRFLDLQKSEAQAREATIEAALEKVRGKAMAMHNSSDLVATAGIVFTELKKLGINTFRSGVGLLTKENREVKLYSATSSEDGDSLSLVGKVLLDGHPVLSQMYRHWIRNEDYFFELKGDLLKQYYEKLDSHFAVPSTHLDTYEQFGYFLPFSEGLFYCWSDKPYTKSEIAILHRFNTIMDLTFRRYIELQKSEANALEAIRRSSVDRVRGEIASMRSTSDLERITPLIWDELTTLEVPFIRCGVFIFNENSSSVQIYLSAPDGHSLGVMDLEFDADPLIENAVDHWRKGAVFQAHWSAADFISWANSLIAQRKIKDQVSYQDAESPPESLDLHFIPFKQGMLYVGNIEPLSADEISLVKALAEAFAIAYARYEDFTKLEKAKESIETTLTDLKATQNQLVQSEKMASLGELTAGIAHEIQNPLNFVNNFSEVSVELIEEMHEELEKGDLKEAMAIAEDVKQNLDKITHHGKRADGIVKGMLQHSRSSNGVKEPTDINVLADEYLRLAYHGLRAKEKSFNATMKTDYDDSLEKVNVIPQDIGRVILNLITNAFYAVNLKSSEALAEDRDYEPTVSVSTKKINGKIEINVTDNGNGIPKKVLAKIFQPFFTTKPTGQGTGLGLSLSYDIVKAHGGEISVKSKVGEGTAFTIALPA